MSQRLAIINGNDHAMSAFAPESYGPLLAEFLAARPLLPLARPVRNEAIAARLAELDPTTLFTGRQIVGPEMASACLAGLWLAHGCLEESHELSQGIANATGSYWHGLMHRLEPDAANSKYWFRRVGPHPVFDDLTAELATTVDQTVRQSLNGFSTWDPCKFIDLCQASARAGGLAEEACRLLQRREWELLFDFCYRSAVGR
jgi:hypothetical protein